MQIAVGICLVLLGLLHFADRHRAPQEIRSYFVGAVIPRSPLVRGTMAVVEIVFGLGLLLTA